MRSRTASDVAVVTLSFVAPPTAHRKIYFFRAVSASFSICSLRSAALAAVHEDTACGSKLLARALKLCWQRTQSDTEPAWLVTLDALSTRHALVSSASTAPDVHYSIRMLDALGCEMLGEHRGASVHVECSLF